MENDTTYAKIITQTSIKEEQEKKFIDLQKETEESIKKFEGYISRDIITPNPPLSWDWIVIEHFVSRNNAIEWITSKERQELIKKIVPILDGNEDIYIVPENQKIKQSTATAVISTSLKPEQRNNFLIWNAKANSELFRFHGFLGYKIEKPRPEIHNEWITVLSFDSKEHLENWLNSETRKKLLNEAYQFTKKFNIYKSEIGFDFWFNKKRRSVWKESMLILLALYPTVFLYSIFIQAHLTKGKIAFAFDLFIANIVSTLLLGYVEVPFLSKLFSWWLKPPPNLEKQYTLLGTFLIIMLYCLLLFIFSSINP